MSTFYHVRSPNIRIMHFWGTSGCCMGIICLHTLTKFTLAVILRGQPSFDPSKWPLIHKIWILWLFCPAWATSALFLANRLWPKIWHLLFLTLLESYNQFLKRNWIYMAVHTGGNSAPRLLERCVSWHSYIILLAKSLRNSKSISYFWFYFIIYVRFLIFHQFLGNKVIFRIF